jgi:hypothetical protein
MNPGGAVEEGAGIARSMIDALRSQPLVLALIVMNLVFVAFVTFVIERINARTIGQYEFKDSLITKLIDECKLGKGATLKLPQLGAIEGHFK